MAIGKEKWEDGKLRKNKFYKNGNKELAASKYVYSEKKSIRRIVEELQERGINAEVCMKV